MRICAGYSYGNWPKLSSGELRDCTSPTSGPPTATTAIPEIPNCSAQFNKTPTGLPVKKNRRWLKKRRQFLPAFKEKRSSEVGVALGHTWSSSSRQRVIILYDVTSRDPGDSNVF